METPADTNEGPIAARIFVDDVEEVRYTVDPWQLRMNQLSCGRLHAAFALAQVHGILLTREFWSHRLAATGLTPPGYVALAGPCAPEGFSWCGSPTGSNGLAYSLDSSEIDFVTLDRDEHWTMLIPIALIEDHLGEELAADLLPKVRRLTGDPRRIAQLRSLVLRAIEMLSKNDTCGTDHRVLTMLEKQLLDTAVGVLLNCDGMKLDSVQAAQRFLAYRRVRGLIEHLRERPSIQQLAKESGVGRRSLEVGFKQAMAISPQRYSRYVRLNGLHRELLLAVPGTLTVTEAAQRWGFRELGRTSGYYRELFGELPSDTLHRHESSGGIRLVDALH